MGEVFSESDAWASIQGELNSIMATSSRVNNQEGKYRYPLSLATYGIEEVMGALESMVSFKTTMWSKTEKFENKFAEIRNRLKPKVWTAVSGQSTNQASTSET